MFLCLKKVIWRSHDLRQQTKGRSLIVSTGLSRSLDPWSPKNPGHFEIWALKFHFEQKKPQSVSTFQTCNLNVICIWVIVIDVNKDCKQLIANLFKMFGAIRRTDLWNIWHLISTSSPELFPKHEQFVSKIRTDFN